MTRAITTIYPANSDEANGDLTFEWCVGVLPPTNLITGVVNEIDINVSWTPDKYTKSQKIYLDGNLVKTVSRCTHANFFGGLSAGGSYTIGVTSVDRLGMESAPVTIVVATPAHISNVTVIPLDFDKISIEWDALPAASDFTVSIEETGSGSSTTTNLPAGTTSYTFTGLTPETNYTCGVLANLSNGLVTDEVTATATTLRFEVHNFTYTDISNSYIALAWDNLSSATGYVLEIYYGQTATLLTSVNLSAGTTAHTFTGLTTNYVYTCKIYATTATETSQTSQLTLITAQQACQLFQSNTVTSSTINFSWSIVGTNPNSDNFLLETTDGAYSFVIPGAPIPNGQTLSYTATGLEDSTSWTWKITFLISNPYDNNPQPSLPATTTAGTSAIVLPAITGFTQTANTTTTISLVWDDMPLADSYYLRTVDGQGDPTGDVDITLGAGTTSYTATVSAGGATGGVFYFRITPIRKGVSGASTGSLMTATVPLAPTVEACTVSPSGAATETSIGIQWAYDTVGSYSYRLRIPAIAYDVTNPATNLLSDYNWLNVTGLQSGTSYSVSLTRIDAVLGHESAEGTAVIATRPAQITGMVQTAGTATDFTYSWNSTPCDNYLVISVKSFDGTHTLFSNVSIPNTSTEQTFSVTAYPNATNGYQVTMCSVANGVQSEFSYLQCKQGTPSVVTASLDINNAVGDTDLNWGAVSGASHYNIFTDDLTLNTTSSTTNFPLATGTSADTDNLPYGSNHVVNIQTVQTDRFPAVPYQITVNMPPNNLAANLYSTAIRATEIDLAWTALTGASSYLINVMNGTTSAIEQTVAVNSGTSTTITGLTTNTQYLFKIGGVNNGNYYITTSNYTGRGDVITAYITQP